MSSKQSRTVCFAILFAADRLELAVLSKFQLIPTDGVEPHAEKQVHNGCNPTETQHLDFNLAHEVAAQQHNQLVFANQKRLLLDQPLHH